MDIRVSGLVWLKKSEMDQDLIKYFRKQLTIVPKKAPGYDETKPIPVRCYKETPIEFGVPRAFWFSTVTQEHNYNWDVSLGHDWDDSPDCLLTHEGKFEEQGDVIDLFIDRFSKASSGEYTDRRSGLLMGGILQADVGWGKTDFSLGLVNHLKATTIVIVHKEFLQKQWMERARKWFPDIKVGLVREKKCDLDGKHIVVAMIQSLALDDGTRYPKELYKWPKLLISDECHRVGAPSWSPVVSKFSSAFRLGLSATPRRLDGADKVFWWHIGEIVYKARTETPKPVVRMIKVKSESLPPIVKRDNVKNPIVINVLTKMKKRNRIAVKEMMKALEAPARRKLFVLSERLDHLRKLEELLRYTWNKAHHDEELTTGFYVGEWFTGEVVPKLAKYTWPMKDGGRDRAIETIYRSIAMRWARTDKDTLCGLKPVVATGKNNGEKYHYVFMRWGVLSSIHGIVTDHSEDDEWVHVCLEDLEDANLYDVAKLYGIAQERNEKMRRRTDAELLEAERARVIFATMQMTSEGVDLPPIDTEILATPVSDVQQAVGRIRRFCTPQPDKCEHFCPWRAGLCQGKPQPVVCDIVDLGVPLASKRERWRREYYDKLGTKVAG